MVENLFMRDCQTGCSFLLKLRNERAFSILQNGLSGNQAANSGAQPPPSGESGEQFGCNSGTATQGGSSGVRPTHVNLSGVLALDDLGF